MKFDVTKVVSGCRLGRLSEFGHCTDKSVETPACMIYTRGGNFYTDIIVASEVLCFISVNIHLWKTNKQTQQQVFTDTTH